MKTFFILFTLTVAAFADVRIEAVPEGGVQPQIAVDEAGTAHLVYLRGAPGASDVRYAKRPIGAKEWSAPVAVNSEPGSAVAMGTIRGAQVVAGGGGRLHVVWNGAMKPGASHEGSGLFYTRLLPGATEFEAQRDLMDGAGLDGGASVAADGKGAVYAVWHGAGATPGEPERVVRVRKSIDHGTTFTAPTIAGEPGVCACCSLRALATSATLTILYRDAHTVGQRDMTLLSSSDGGVKFRSESVGKWTGNTGELGSGGTGVRREKRNGSRVQLIPKQRVDAPQNFGHFPPHDDDSICEWLAGDSRGIPQDRRPQARPAMRHRARGAWGLSGSGE